jgi:hypothetical protein
MLVFSACCCRLRGWILRCHTQSCARCSSSSTRFKQSWTLRQRRLQRRLSTRGEGVAPELMANTPLFDVAMLPVRLCVLHPVEEVPRRRGKAPLLPTCRCSPPCEWSIASASTTARPL